MNGNVGAFSLAEWVTVRKEIAQPAHKDLKSLLRIGTQECGTSPTISMQKREIFRCLIIADPPIGFISSDLFTPVPVKLFTEERDNLLFSQGPRGKQNSVSCHWQ